MAKELSTIGIKLYYATASSDGSGAATIPNTLTSWHEIANVTSIGEISASPEQLEVTNLQDSWKRYVAGVRDNSGTIAIGANFTEDFKTAWEAAVTAYATALAANKQFWWAVVVPNFFAFYVAGEPNALGLPSIEVNKVFQGTVNITANDIVGWRAFPES